MKYHDERMEILDHLRRNGIDVDKRRLGEGPTPKRFVKMAGETKALRHYDRLTAMRYSMNKGLTNQSISSRKKEGNV